MMRLFDKLYFFLFARWFRVEITDPELIKQIKEEFGITDGPR